MIALQNTFVLLRPSTLNLRQLLTRRGLLTRVEADQALKHLQRNPELDKESAQNELRWLMENAKESHGSEAEKFQVLKSKIKKRSKGEPLQYVLGDTDFGPLCLFTRPPVLIPRPETAFVFERLAKYVVQLENDPSLTSKPLSLLDLYTGSAAVALLLAHIAKGHIDEVVGLDISHEAIELAKDNEERLRSAAAKTVFPRVSFSQVDICDTDAVLAAGPVRRGRYGIVTANPPYISMAEIGCLPSSVKDYEDLRALSSSVSWTSDNASPSFSPSDGTEHYLTIAKLLPDLLSSEEEMLKTGWRGLPRVAVEIGSTQADKVQQILVKESSGLISRTECWKDQFGKDRLIVGWNSTD